MNSSRLAHGMCANKYLRKLALCLTIGICVNVNTINSMDYNYSNTIEQYASNKMEQSNSKNMDRNIINNSKMRKLLNVVFRTDEFFKQYDMYIDRTDNAANRYWHEVKHWVMPYQKSVADCDYELKQHEEDLTTSYNNFISVEYNKNNINNQEQKDDSTTYDFLTDVANIFSSIHYSMGDHSTELRDITERYWQEHTYVKASELLKYKQLFDKCIMHNSITNEFIDAMDNHISNVNINNEYISFKYLLYYVRNKILQLGSVTLKNLDKNPDYNSTVKANKNILNNTFDIIKQMASYIEADIYNKNNVIVKQTSKKVIKNKYENLILWDGALFIPDTSEVEIHDDAEIMKLLTYPKALNITIDSKINKFNKQHYTTRN